MARIDVVMPQMGESITTGTITKWHKSVGDSVDIDEILLESGELNAHAQEYVPPAQGESGNA